MKPTITKRSCNYSVNQNARHLPALSPGGRENLASAYQGSPVSDFFQRGKCELPAPEPEGRARHSVRAVLDRETLGRRARSDAAYRSVVVQGRKARQNVGGFSPGGEGRGEGERSV